MKKTTYICDRCRVEGSEQGIQKIVMPVPDGHITRIDVWKEIPSGFIDLCGECLMGYRSWWNAVAGQ